MPNYRKTIRAIRVLIVITVIGLVSYAGWWAWDSEVNNQKTKKTLFDNGENLFINSNNLTEGKRVSYTGRVEAIDLAGTANGRPGIYKIKPLREEAVTIYLHTGETACDKIAIKVPEVNIGAIVKVHGDKGDDGIIQVCEAGTYIKLP